MQVLVVFQVKLGRLVEFPQQVHEPGEGEIQERAQAEIVGLVDGGHRLGQEAPQRRRGNPCLPPRA